MFKNVFMWVLTNVFKINSETTEKDIGRNDKFSKEYKAIGEINFDAIFSNKLSNYIASDSTLTILGENQRADLLNKTGQSMWKKIKKISAMALGTGGVCIVPYVKGGKIYYNLVTQDRLSIDKTDGDLITGATILAEKKTIKSQFNETTYLRWTNYDIQNNTLVITQQYSDKEGKKIPTPDFWANIQEVMSISNVDRVPFGFIKSSANNRRSNDEYGVPITYGCDNTINEIRECLSQIATEFSAKEVMVLLDKTAFGKDNQLPMSRIFKKVDSGVDDFYKEFSPAIRESSYYARLQELYSRLEKEVGTSAGILTEIETSNATATAIRRSMYDTFTIVDDMRANIEIGLQDFFNACNILANAYNLSAMGEYEVSFDWDYSMLEDSQETFNQLVAGYNNNVISGAELRNWIKSSESMEDSEEKVQELTNTNPQIKDLIGE